MNQSVVIKANNFGIMVVLEPDIPFEELKKDVAAKFAESSKFLGDASMALGFDGRELTVDEEKQLLDVIAKNSSLKIVCLIDKDENREEEFKKALESKIYSLDMMNARFYKGNLRSGQVMDFESGVVVLGDINPGAKISSNGNIVIIGALKGTAYAGANGNENAFVIALSMNPMQLRIGDVLGRSSDSPEENEKGPQIAFVEDGNIYIESIDKNILSNIHIE